MTIDPDIAARAMERDPEGARALLVVLRSVDEGEMSADGAAAVAVVHRIQGALLALAESERSRGA